MGTRVGSARIHSGLLSDSAGHQSWRWASKGAPANREAVERLSASSSSMGMCESGGVDEVDGMCRELSSARLSTSRLDGARALASTAPTPPMSPSSHTIGSDTSRRPGGGGGQWRPSFLRGYVAPPAPAGWGDGASMGHWGAEGGDRPGDKTERERGKEREKERDGKGRDGMSSSHESFWDVIAR